MENQSHSPSIMPSDTPQLAGIPRTSNAFRSARSSSQNSAPAGSTKCPDNDREGFTAAWVAAVQADGGSLSPHLIPGGAPHLASDEEGMSGLGGLKNLVRVWMLFRRDCYLVVASFLLGAVVASIAFQ